MPYLGSAPTTSFQTLAKQDFSVSATASYTLSQSVTSANDIALFINNVRQEPTTAYSASGTSLTLTEATAGSDDMYCVYIGRAVGTINPASGSVGMAQLSATGTKSSSTFLRGDNSFATIEAGEKNDIYWSAYGTTDQTSLTNNTINTVVFNNTWSQSSHNGYSTSTGKFTVPSGGKGIYHIYGFATIGGTGTANNHTRSLYTWVYKNTSSALARTGHFLTANYYEGTQGSNNPVTTLQLLEVGDTVEIKIQAYGNDFSVDHLSYTTHFSGYRVLAVS